MREIKNVTRKPLRIPLPNGKSVFVGPLKVAQVTDRAVDHPAVKKLVEDGVIEIVGEGARPTEEHGGGHGKSTTQGNTKTFRRGQGDR